MRQVQVERQSPPADQTLHPPALTIIVPTLNEEGNVLPLLTILHETVPGAEVVVADDNSADGTRDAARMFRGAVSVRVLHRRVPHDKGLTASVADAILEVTTPFLVVMDADFQHPPATLPRLLEALQGSDVAVATRENDDAFQLHRRLISRGGRALARRYLWRQKRIAVQDPMSGFFAMRTDVAQRIVHEHGARFERSGFKVLVDLLLHAPPDVRVAEVPYTFSSRQSGESKLHSRHYLSLLRQLGPMGRLSAGFLDILFTGILFRFLAVGASGVLVNSFTLFSLHEALGLHLYVATLLAIEFSVLWNFAWNESWTFRGRGQTSVGNRLAKFHLASAVGMVIMFGTVAFASAFYPHVWYLAANLVGIALGSAVNFLINLHWTWGMPVEEIETGLPE